MSSKALEEGEDKAKSKERCIGRILEPKQGRKWNNLIKVARRGICFNSEGKLGLNLHEQKEESYLDGHICISMRGREK